MADAGDLMVNRRSRRSTAGNRMDIALAELALETPDSAEDVEADVDFVVKDEDDIFESDFASTDDEAEQQALEGLAGEQLAGAEERQARKAARSRTERAIQGAAQRQRATFHPQSASSASVPNVAHIDSSSITPRKVRIKRKASLGTAHDAESGQVVETANDGLRRPTKTRQSRRQSTIVNTNQTVIREQENKTRRATLMKKAKTVTRIPTQAELIAQALEREEGNVLEHRNYLAVEEEKRQRAKVVRTTIKGPLLRFLSRAEEVQRNPTTQLASMVPSSPDTAGGMVSQYGWEYTGWAAGPSAMTALRDRTAALYPALSENTYTSPGLAVNAPGHPLSLYVPAATQSYAALQQEQVAVSYLLHELDQTDQTMKPSWKETMEAIFGDHVRWEDLGVYAAKGRPLGRKIHHCPLTGFPAKYLDPRTGVPFSNVDAYQTLMEFLEHSFVWDDTVRCYVGK